LESSPHQPMKSHEKYQTYPQFLNRVNPIPECYQMEWDCNPQFCSIFKVLVVVWNVRIWVNIIVLVVFDDDEFVTCDFEAKKVDRPVWKSETGLYFVIPLHFNF